MEAIDEKTLRLYCILRTEKDMASLTNKKVITKKSCLKDAYLEGLVKGIKIGQELINQDKK